MKHSALATYMVLLFGVSGCTQWDMQGHDPRQYYEEHPIKNSVEIKSEAYRVMFEPGASKLSAGEREHFRQQINQRSMLAVQEIMVDMSANDSWHMSSRQTNISKMLKFMGYHGNNIRFQVSQSVPNNNAVIHMTYAEVVSPRCPDWRKSPSNNYSNSSHANFGCATEVNLGHMVADPRDLIRGTGELPPVLSERGDKILRDYYSGAASEDDGGGEGSDDNTTNVEPSGLDE